MAIFLFLRIAVNRLRRLFVVWAEDDSRDCSRGKLTMHVSRRIRFAIAALSAVLFVGTALAQPRPAAPPRAATPATATSDKDVAAMQEELIRLLRLSPTLTTVVEHDPSLLANQEYVRKNNPQLAQYLESHPEIALNPEFYLFSHLKQNDNGP